MSKDSTPKKPSVIRDKCGTYAGYKAHENHKENLCSECRKAASTRNREYRKKNAIKIKAYANQYRLVNREKGINTSKAWRLDNRERSVAGQKAWHAANKEKRNATILAWRLANPEKVREMTRVSQEKYRLKNPENSRKTCRTRRARRLNVPSEPYTTQDILDLWGTNCYNCGETIDLNAPRRVGLVGWEQGLHLDHVIPLALGGSDLMINVKPSHGLCNLRKSKTTKNLAY